MKTFLYSLLISTLFIAPAWADSHEAGVAEEENGINIQIDLDDDDASENKNTEEELERKINSKVFSIIGDIIDAAVDGGLTVEEKDEIKEAIADIEELTNDAESIHFSSGDTGTEAGEVMIALTAILFTFGTPIMIIAAVLYSSYRKKRLMHETIDQYVTSGKDIPDEVLKGLQKEVTPKNNLHRGLVMSGVGLGIFACFAVIGSLEAAAIGLIPLFIGLAQLLIWKLENK